MARHAALLVALSLMAASATAPAQTSSYQEEIDAWRSQREASLTADDGWLTVAGLFFLEPGENTVGSHPGSDILLPAASAPPRVGTLRFRGGRVMLQVDRGDVRINGKRARFAELRPSGGGRPADQVTIGDVTLMVHRSGNRYAIRLRDKQSLIRKSFSGLEWFPIDERYRVRGRFVRHREPRILHIPNILGDLERYTSPGVVVFRLDGREMRLEPALSNPEARRLFFIFQDLTSGEETYPTARFLYANLLPGDEVVLDFNQAYNPPCAYNPYTTCPRTPEQNRLPVRIEAGERMPPGAL